MINHNRSLVQEVYICVYPLALQSHYEPLGLARLVPKTIQPIVTVLDCPPGHDSMELIFEDASHTLKIQNTEIRLPLSSKSLSLWLPFTVPEVCCRVLVKKSYPPTCPEGNLLAAELTHSTDLTSETVP